MAEFSVPINDSTILIEELLKIFPKMAINRSVDDLNTPYSCLELKHNDFTVVICRGRDFKEASDPLKRNRVHTKILFEKTSGCFTEIEADSIIAIYISTNKIIVDNIHKLSTLGVKIYEPNQDKITWESLGGYNQVKESIHSSISLCLKYPDLFTEVTKLTRKVPEKNKPKAILFEGKKKTPNFSNSNILNNF